MISHCPRFRVTFGCRHRLLSHDFLELASSPHTFTNTYCLLPLFATPPSISSFLFGISYVVFHPPIAALCSSFLPVRVPLLSLVPQSRSSQAPKGSRFPPSSKNKQVLRQHYYFNCRLEQDLAAACKCTLHVHATRPLSRHCLRLPSFSVTLGTFTPVSYQVFTAAPSWP